MAEQEAPAEEQPADYEAPKEEEAAAEEPKAEEEAPAGDDAPAEEEAPAQEEAPAEEPKEEEPAADYEAPKEEEAAVAEEEPKAEEPPKEEPKAEEPPKAEEKPKEEEEVKVEEAPKKKKKKKKKKKAASSGDCQSEEMWNEISKKNGSEINWYIMKLKGKVGNGEDLECIEKGAGGVKEMVTFFTDKPKGIYFGLLRVTTSDIMSVRAKFIYMKFLGTTVKTMTKAKLTGSLGKIEDKFPCKHLSVDINEKDCAEDLKPEKLAKELLRVGGAHKPDKMSFGPDQEVDVTNMG